MKPSHFGPKKQKSKGAVQAGAESESSLLKLPSNVIPTRYTMCIKPNLASLECEGCVGIDCEIKRETKYIIVHAVDMNISKIIWEEDVTENRQEPLEYLFDAEKERIKIIFEPPLVPSVGNLRINFNTKLSERSIGFYRVKYGGKDGQEKYIGATNFSQDWARICFPCWEDPSVKSTFDLSLIIPKDITVLSNTLTKVEYAHRSNPELHIVEFETTPKMNSSIAAFAIGEFGQIESTPHTFPCKLYGLPEKVGLGQFAINITEKAVLFFQNYFDMKFPLKKLDIVALDYSFKGGVRNWGLITFKESEIYMDEQSNSIERRAEICSHISNQTIQQWFGNCVSMPSWAQYWLIKGMAWYLETMSLSELEPEFDAWGNFFMTKYLLALKMDGMRHIHPVEIQISSSAEIKEFYDEVIFYKAAALIRMLQKYIGEENFRKALQTYLHTYEYDNSSPELFFLSLEQASGKPVLNLMNNWITKQGCPLIKITSAKFEINQRTIVLQQEKFISDPSSKPNKESLWMIPITVSLGSNPNRIIKEIMFSQRQTHFIIPNITRTQWFKINPGSFGFCRVKYPPEMLGQFMHVIRTRVMPPIDRITILNDLYAFAECGLTSTGEVLSLMEAYMDEDNYMVWLEIENVFEGLDHLLSTTDFYDKFKYYGRSIYGNIYDRLGWHSHDSEKYQTKKLRILILSRMFTFDHDKVRHEMISKFEMHFSGEEILAIEFRGIVFKAIMSISGTNENYRMLLRLFRESDSRMEKQMILGAIVCSRDEEVLRDAVDFVFSDDVSLEDTIIALKSLGKNPIGRNILWEYFKSHFSLFRTRYPGGPLSNQLMRAILGYFITDEKLSEISDYFREHSYPGVEHAIQQSLERIHINSEWRKRDLILISDYLTSFE